MSQNKKLNIAFAGGWSGWHVMPISSLIRYIYKSEKYSDLVDNIFWFGQKWQMEEREFEKLKSEYMYNNKKWKLICVFWLIWSWKSTVSEHISKKIWCKWIQVDKLRREMYGEPDFWWSKEKEQYESVKEKAHEIIKEELLKWKNIVFERPMWSNEHRKIYIDICKELNSKLTLLYCEWSDDIIINRIKNREINWNNFSNAKSNIYIYTIKNDWSLNDLYNKVDKFLSKEMKSDNPSSINNNDLKFLPILSWKLRRQPDFKEVLLNIADIFNFAIWIFQSLWYIYINKIDVVFCKWWYVALPVVFAAKILGRRILVHESDTKSWLVNKIAARFADKVYTWFPWVLAREQVVGQIISDNIVPSENLSTQSDKITILVNLWSLGSSSVHDALLDIFNKFPNVILEYEWHIILGSLNADYEDKYKDIIDKVAINRASTKSSLHIYTFVDQKVMWELLYKTDISICRWGTTSLAEQKMFGIKQLIVPIPWTHDQAKNADYYVDHHKDIYIKQDKSASILWDNIYKEIVWLNNFHKIQPDLNQIKQQIETAKKIICNEVFGL